MTNIYVIAFCILLTMFMVSGMEQTDSPFVELFGTTLYQWSPNKSDINEVNTTTVLHGKNTVAVYYSASWCGPCKQFTPALAQFYADMNKKGKKFEIVWVSRDQTQEDFVAYYQQMPWLAVTIENLQHCVEKTSQKYQVRGIPHLVVLDGYDASVYTLEGRAKVAADQYGLEFPWRPRTPGNLIKQLLPRSLQTSIRNRLLAAKQKLVSAVHSLLSSLFPKKLLNLLFSTART